MVHSLYLNSIIMTIVKVNKNNYNVLMSRYVHGITKNNELVITLPAGSGFSTFNGGLTDRDLCALFDTKGVVRVSETTLEALEKGVYEGYTPIQIEEE